MIPRGAACHCCWVYNRNIHAASWSAASCMLLVDEPRDRRLASALHVYAYYAWRHRNVCSTAPSAPPMMLPIPNPNPKTNPNPNPIFNLNPNPFFERKQKRHRNISQRRVIFITYFRKVRGWVYKRPISRTWSFSYWVHVFLWRHTLSTHKRAVRSQDTRVWTTCARLLHGDAQPPTSEVQSIVTQMRFHRSCKQDQIRNTKTQWLKLFPLVKVILWSRGRLIRRSQVGSNPIPIPTPLICRYLGIK